MLGRISSKTACSRQPNPTLTLELPDVWYILGKTRCPSGMRMPTIFAQGQAWPERDARCVQYKYSQATQWRRAPLATWRFQAICAPDRYWIVLNFSFPVQFSSQCTRQAAILDVCSPGALQNKRRKGAEVAAEKAIASSSSIEVNDRILRIEAEMMPKIYTTISCLIAPPDEDRKEPRVADPVRDLDCAVHIVWQRALGLTPWPSGLP